MTDFERFWNVYPRKTGKKSALRAWEKLNPPPLIVDEIFAALGWQKLQVNWRKCDGQYVPHPATWLNGRRWEDEDPKAQKISPQRRAPTEADIAHARRIMAEQDAARDRDRPAVLAEYYRTHPWARPITGDAR